jgi:tetratricopeptide (TPR) repeat protein
VPVTPGRWVRLLNRARLSFWLLLGRPDRALAQLDAQLSQWPDDAHALASRSHLRAQAGHHDAALVDARALVAAHPARCAADWFNLAYLLEGTGRLEEAEPTFRRALELDDRLDRAWYGLGLTLVRLGRLDEAAQALERSTLLQPMSPFGWYQLARVHVDRQAPDEARRIIRHLQGFEPRVAAQLERETGLAA